MTRKEELERSIEIIDKAIVRQIKEIRDCHEMIRYYKSMRVSFEERLNDLISKEM